MIPLVCPQCNSDFERQINFVNRNKKYNYINFCSYGCAMLNKVLKQEVRCLNCDTSFYKLLNQIKKYPNHFCSSSCVTTYNNKRKTWGTCRSKLEFYIEEQLKSELPHISFLANNKETIGSELDFYFPDLKLAIEINGPTHYLPIYGEKKLSQTQANDKLKRIACEKASITLATVDNLKSFSLKFANSVWLEVKAILNEF